MTAPTTSALPVALKRARKAAGFSNAKAFLVALKDAEGSAPSYSTYAQWESGEVTPRDESLAPVRRYHEGRGTWVETEAAPDLATALLALAHELAALREERATMRAELDDLQALVGRLAQERLSEPAPEGSRGPGARPQTVG